MATVVLLALSGSVFAGSAATAGNQVCDVKADFALGREDYATAIKFHQEVVHSDPSDALAHYHLGFAYGMVGRSAEELSEYLTSVRLGLKHWDLFLNLGLAYLQQQKLDRAIEALEAAASLGPEHAEPHFNLALAYESEGRLSDALREITAARRLAPNDLEAANINAIIFVKMGDFAPARNIWRLLTSTAPDYVAARENLAILDRLLTHHNPSGFQSEFAFEDQNLMFLKTPPPGPLDQLGASRMATGLRTR